MPALRAPLHHARPLPDCLAGGRGHVRGGGRRPSLRGSARLFRPAALRDHDPARVAELDKLLVDRGQIGSQITDPNIDYARLAQSLGVYAEGPIASPADLGPALKRAIAVVVMMETIFLLSIFAEIYTTTGGGPGTATTILSYLIYALGLQWLSENRKFWWLWPLSLSGRLTA